jgi:hypothetical protein
MAIFEISARRLILAGGFALTVAAAPAVAAVTVPTLGLTTNVADCVSGEEEDLYTGECVPHTVPNSPFSTNAANPDIPEIDGVPCTGGRSSGACIGLSENAVPDVVPQSTESNSPTVHGEE